MRTFSASSNCTRIELQLSMTCSLSGMHEKLRYHFYSQLYRLLLLFYCSSISLILYLFVSNSLLATHIQLVLCKNSRHGKLSELSTTDGIQHTTTGHHSFPVAAAIVWNILPVHVQSSPSVTTFR